ncbi:MAG: membrane protein insertase YidC [Deltaproteobacteria bacterium]|nr:membrane protein insertase YidC [Deltaproteobacteria bacterium]
MDKRTFLAIALSMAVIFLYQTFFVKPPPPKQKAAQQTEQTAAEPSAGQGETPAAPAKPATAEQMTATKIVTVEDKAIPEKESLVETPLYTAVFTNQGAALKSLKLKKYYRTLPPDRHYQLTDFLKIFQSKKDEAVKEAELIELVHVKNGMPRPLSVTFPDSNINVPAKDAYEANTDALDLTRAPDKYRLTYTRTYPNNMKIEKMYTFHPDTYNVDLEVRVYNLSPNPITQNAALTWHQYADPKAESSSYGHEGPITYISQKVNRIDVKKIEKDETHGPDVVWGGYESKYFIASLIPQNPSLTSVAVVKDTDDMVSVTLKGTKNLIPPGQAGMFSYSLFLGPKDHSILKTQGAGLENAVDFQSWMPGLKWLSLSLLIALKFINQYVHNFGIAIIIITILIKILFWPLGNMSYKSMKEMQKLQPKVAELREKYKDDRNKIGQETMALYKSHKVNPLSGCLPMLIQIPVFFGFYTALLYSIELRHAPFIWWIQDLSDKDPYYITPIVMGATMFLQQKMSPPMGDPMQAKVMMFMPIIFTFLFLNFASGLVLYWLFNNIISIGQQVYINKRAS